MKLSGKMSRLWAALLCVLLLACAQASAEECQHINSDFRYDNVRFNDDDKWTANSDGLTHSRYGETWDRYYCYDCFSYFDKNHVSGLIQREHLFDGSTGKCYYCDYECLHTNVSEYLDVYRLNDGETWKADSNGKTHSAKGERYDEYYCHRCNYDRKENVFKGTLTKEHWFVGGECYDCDYQCPHEGNVQTYYNSYTIKDGEHWKDDKNGLTHSVSITRYDSYWCTDCSDSWRKNERDEVLTEYHWGINKCYDCGTYNMLERTSWGIQQHPRNVTATVGDKVKMTIETWQNTNVGMPSDDYVLTYQWYYRNAGASAFKNSGKTGKTYTATMTESMAGREVYCVVTDQYGHKEYSEIATILVPELRIITQPKNVTVSDGETAKFTVKAEGDGLKYQWYYQNADSKTWKEASSKSASYSLKMEENRNGRKFYCEITDAYGKVVNSKTVWMKRPVVEITKQPSNAWAYDGEKAKISLTATGDGLKYQWYYRTSSTGSWKEASGTKSSYSLTMDEKRDGRQMKCIVTDQYGKTAESDVVKLSTRFKAKITKQPSNAKAVIGEKAKTSVTATGDGLTYQWYYKNPGSSSFKKSSIVKASCSVEMTKERDGRQMYCIVTDKYGNTAKSNTITLSVKKLAKITTEPKSVTVSADKTAKFTVKAEGDGLKYQWYYSTNSGKTWKKASSTSASYSLKNSVDRNGRKFYCEITDAYGTKVKTKEVTMKLPVVKITSEPKSVTMAKDKTAKFTVKATGDGLKYQWYYSTDSGKTWKKASSTSATYSLKATKDRNGRRFYCKITDAYGTSVKTEKVKLTVK